MAHLVAGHHDHVEQLETTQKQGACALFLTRLPSVSLRRGAPVEAVLLWRRDAGPRAEDGTFPEVVRVHSLCLPEEARGEVARLRPLIEERTERLLSHISAPNVKAKHSRTGHAPCPKAAGGGFVWGPPGHPTPNCFHLTCVPSKCSAFNGDVTNGFRLSQSSVRVRSATTASVGSSQHWTALTLDFERLSRVL